MIIKISGVVGSWEVDPQEIVYQIENSNENIDIELDSVGGSVIAGIQIANAIRDHKAKGYEVNIIGGAVVASIATYIAMQGTTFTIRDNTTFMIHNAWLPVIGDFNELRKAADLSEGLSSIIAKDYIKKTGTKEDEIKTLMNEETYYYGSEIKEKGFADEIKETETELNKSEALALTMESLKACNNAIIENENVSFEAVAKLLPNSEVNPKEEQQQEDTPVSNVNAKLKRAMTLTLKERF